MEREVYNNNNVEWKERVEKWKARQEKKGLVSRDGGGGDDHDEEDDILYGIFSLLPLFPLITKSPLIRCGVNGRWAGLMDTTPSSW